MHSLLIAFLLLISAPAAAEWVTYWEDDQANYYYDPATVEVDGDLCRVWTTEDYKRDTRGAMSRRFRGTYDCVEERRYILSLSVHSEPQGSGDILHAVENPPNEWTYIAPRTRDAAILKIVCAVR